MQRLVDGSIRQRQTADMICTAFFGDGWRIGTIDDMAGTWSQAVKVDGGFLIWHSDLESVVERHP